MVGGASSQNSIDELFCFTAVCISTMKSRSLKIILLPALLLGSLIFIIAFGSNKDAQAQGFVQPIRKSLIVIGSLTDATTLLRGADVAALNDLDFDAVGETAVFGFSDATHWLKIRVFNTGNTLENKVLEVANPILNACNLYEVKGTCSIPLFESGDDLTFAERPMPHLSYQFPVVLEPNSTREFLLQVSTKGEQLQLPIALFDREEIAQRDEKDRLIRGVYFGIILFVLLFNIFIYFVIKEKSSLYYVLYVFGLLMLQLSLGGFAFRYLWPESSYLANVANPFFASLSIFALIRFVQTFLNLSEFYPRLNKAFNYTGHIVALNCLLALIYTPLTFKISVLAINSLALLLNIAIIPTVLLVLRKNFKPARYFLYAFIVLVLSVFVFIMGNFGVFNSPFYASYGLQIGSAVEVILLSFAVVDKFKIFRDDAYTRLATINTMKVKANEVLERTVTERTREVVEQKQVVEQQKEEIIDSIRYAERIQKSLLPTANEIAGLFAENFVLFKPKDIVSGDFYWFGETKAKNPWGANTKHLFAAVDCTGHGVPGAIMSIIGHNSLEQCLSEKSVQNPADVLNYLNNEIMRSLQHDHSGEQNVSDGMDLIFCAYDPISRQLEFAGAKNNLYILRKGEYIEVKGDRKSIGMDPIHAENGFTNHSIGLEPDDRLYTFTDGYPDQFGGADNKKFKARTLLGLIADLAHLGMEEQRAALQNQFDDWRGANEQIDDVCVLGIRVG